MKWNRQLRWHSLPIIANAYNACQWHLFCCAMRRPGADACYHSYVSWCKSHHDCNEYSLAAHHATHKWVQQQGCHSCQETTVFSHSSVTASSCEYCHWDGRGSMQRMLFQCTATSMSYPTSFFLSFFHLSYTVTWTAFQPSLLSPLLHTKSQLLRSSSCHPLSASASAGCTRQSQRGSPSSPTPVSLSPARQTWQP
jgi:hypothetical protein